MVRSTSALCRRRKYAHFACQWVLLPSPQLAHWWARTAPAILFYRMMNRRRFLLTAAAKLPIAMVGRLIILAMGDILRPNIFERAKQFLPLSPASCKCSLNGNNRKKQFLSLCATQISVEMTTPTSGGSHRGMGIQDRGRALADENRSRFYTSRDLRNVKYLLTK